MAMMMEKAGNRHLMEVLTYHGAGHLIEPPYLPTIQSTNYYLLWKKKRSMHALCLVSFFYMVLIPSLDFICDCVLHVNVVVIPAVVVLWGGQTKLHAYAQEDAWEKILQFLWQHLYISSVLH